MKISNDDHQFNFEMSESEISELAKLSEITAGLGDSETGLGRNEYCVTCSSKGEGGKVVQWTEKAYNSVLAHLQGAPKCLKETGNPSNSVSKGSC